jgi:hypothetical protein
VIGEKMTNLIKLGHIEFQTVEQLLNGITRLIGAWKPFTSIHLNEIYVKDIDGNELTLVELEQETLSDGSTVFNLVLSEATDPNS